MDMRSPHRCNSFNAGSHVPRQSHASQQSTCTTGAQEIPQMGQDLTACRRENGGMLCHDTEYQDSQREADITCWPAGPANRVVRRLDGVTAAAPGPLPGHAMVLRLSFTLAKAGSLCPGGSRLPAKSSLLTLAARALSSPDGPACMHACMHASETGSCHRGEPVEVLLTLSRPWLAPCLEEMYI